MEKVTEMKKCYNCGNIMKDTDKFCENCGANMEEVPIKDIKGSYEKKSGKKSNFSGLYICSAVLGAMIIAMIAVAILLNIKGNDSKNYLNDDYRQLCDNIKSTGIILAGDNKEKYNEITSMIRDIDSCDEDVVKNNIKKLNDIVAKLKQYKSKSNELNKKIKENDKNIKDNGITKKCKEYSSECKSILNDFDEKIKENDMSGIKNSLKKLTNACDRYTAAKENYIIWKKYKNDIEQISETASGKNIAEYDEIAANKRTADMALEDYENAIGSDSAKSVKKMKSKLLSAVKKYKTNVNDTEAKKTVIYKYKYLPSIRDNYGSYENDFVAYDSRNYVMDVDSIVSWLKSNGASDREIACWFTLAINEISARYGAKFSIDSLVSYFYSKSWYENLGYDANDIRGAFTSVEKSNFDNFGKMRNKYCNKLGISTGSKEYSYEEFSYISENYSY